ncbi:MAG: FAD/NAD(P)-binding protein [bacterium]
MMNNPYLPHQGKILSVKQETAGDRVIRTFRIQLEEDAYREAFAYQPGQCAMVGVPGVGESMISIASSPTQKGSIAFSIMKLGKVTSALHAREAGDPVTVRGPYGNHFPVEEWKGKNIVTIGGGIGQAPLWGMTQYLLDNRQDYGTIDIIYGARTTADLCFKEELYALEKRDDVRVHLSIDVKEEGWERFVGFVPTNLLRVKPSPENAIAITCGPPVMIRFVLKNLQELGFSDDQIYTTLENRMKCGIGKCGRCNVGPLYVCKDGPVFSFTRLKTLPETHVV